MKNNPFDLSKSFKINKRVFQVGLGVILFLFLITILIDGIDIIKGVKYVECPADSLEGCKNPFYDSTLMFADELSRDPELTPGQILGHKPSWLSINMVSIVMLIVSLCIIINYVIVGDFKKDIKKLREMER